MTTVITPLRVSCDPRGFRVLYRPTSDSLAFPRNAYVTGDIARGRIREGKAVAVSIVRDTITWVAP